MLEARIILTSFAMGPAEMLEILRENLEYTLSLDAKKHWVIVGVRWSGTCDELRAKLDALQLNCNCHLIVTDNVNFVNEDYGIPNRI